MLKGLLVDLEPFTSEWEKTIMHAHFNNESKLWATMGDNSPITRAEIKRMQEERAEGRERGYPGVHFMMRARDGKIIGSMGIGWISYQNRVAWLGAWIGEQDYWGGGHGTDALLLLCDYAFDWLDMRRLCLGTMAINERAQRNVEKVGFKLEGRKRGETLVNGEWLDGLSYGMMREEWVGREALVEQLGLRERAEQRYGTVAE